MRLRRLLVESLVTRECRVRRRVDEPSDIKDLRRRIMNAKRLVATALVLAFVAAITGCQSGYGTHDRMMSADQMRWSQGPTGFPHPVPAPQP